MKERLGTAGALRVVFLRRSAKDCAEMVALEGLPHLQSLEPGHQFVPKSHRA